MNRSKESLELNLKDQKDLDILKLLLKRADVLVQNLAPGATDRLGLSYEKLCMDYPALIVCDISGYSQDGPYSEKKAYDLLVQSEAGVLSVTGTPTEPVKVGLPIADISAGMYAYSNILAALVQRNKTEDGRGCRIDVSMLESLVEWAGFPMYYSFNNAPGPGRTGVSHPTVYPYGPFSTGDRGSVMLEIQNKSEWVKFCEVVLDTPDLASNSLYNTNSLRSENRHSLKDLIHQVFSKFTASEILERLDRAQIANAKVNNIHGLWNHPQLQARSRWTEVKTSTGVIPALLPSGILSSETTHDKIEICMDEVHSVGHHNAKILAGLGIKR